MLKLKSIKAEAEDCKKAWKNKKLGTMAVHCHHESMNEEINEPAINRITYILNHKPLKEQALRLRLFRPVTNTAWAEYQKVKNPALAEYEKVTNTALAEYEKVTNPAWAEYEKVKNPALAEYLKVINKAHNLICKTKDCPWNGKTIFP